MIFGEVRGQNVKIFKINLVQILANFQIFKKFFWIIDLNIFHLEVECNYKHTLKILFHVDALENPGFWRYLGKKFDLCSKI